MPDMPDLIHEIIQIFHALSGEIAWPDENRRRHFEERLDRLAKIADPVECDNCAEAGELGAVPSQGPAEPAAPYDQENPPAA